MKTDDKNQDIETLRARHDQLKEQRTTAMADLKHAEDQLRRLQEQAKAKYGTDDLEKLRAELVRMRSDNEKKRQDYQKHLDAIDEQLRTLEKEREEAAAAAEEEAPE